MSNEYINENLEISDFQLASFLLYKNIELIGIRKESPTKAVFIFPRGEVTEKLLQLFSSLHASVEPLSFSTAQKRLKQLLYISLRS